MTEKHIVVNKLLMSNGIGPVDCDASEAFDAQSMGDAATETLCHEYKKKGGEGIPLPDTSGGGEGGEGMPLTRTEKKEEDMRLMTHLIHVGLKP